LGVLSKANMNFGILVDPLYKPADLVEIARQIEQVGFSSFWYPDEKYFRDCYIGLALVAANTHQIRLGPCVTDPYSRHPIQTAAAIGSLAEIAPDRVWLGIGAGGRGLSEIGIQMDHPATAIKEAIEIVRRLLLGESVKYDGRVIRLQERTLDFKPPQNVKIMVGTGHGRFIQQMAGEIADAVMLANYATPSTIQKALQYVEKGAARVNRSLESIYLISRVDVSLHSDVQKARQAVAPKILSALRASYPDLNYLQDLPEFELSSNLLSVLNKKDYHSRSYYADPKRSAKLIPLTLTENLSIAGDPDEVANKLQAIINMGIFNEITIRPVMSENQTIYEFISLFCDTVLPQLH
jgi:5,10-methylenetetrahydromethanopterin reductase